MEITFKDITRIIKKNIVFIAVLSLLCAAASYFVTTFLAQKTYTSTVKLYVETNYKSQSAYDDYQSINYAKNLVLTYIELLDSNSFYNSVSKELNEKYTASQLKSMIKFESIEDTEVFKALVNSGSPSESKNIGNAIAKIAPDTIANVKDNVFHYCRTNQGRSEIRDHFGSQARSCLPQAGTEAHSGDSA